MSFPRYPAYRDSGVEWLGEIPCEWTVARFDKHAYTHRLSITPDQLDGQVVLHYSIPSIQETGRGAIEEGGSIDSSKLVINQPQLLVSKLNPHKQVVVLAKPHDELLTVSSTEFVPLVSITANSDYMRYAWQSSTCLDYLLARCDSATRSHQRVSPDDISKMLWAWPNKKDQSQIASFLDHETAKIDALVAEQERLIELLKEKRQAVISHAVTKGLDPSVPMKDSGVKWLGEVPEHWTVSSLRHSLTHIFNGLTADQIEPGPDTVPVTRIETISDGTINYERVGFISAANARPDRKLKSGDICFSNINSLKMIGNCAIFLGEAEIYGGMNLLVLRPLSTLNSRYLYWAIRSSGFRETVESLAKPAINQASISQSSLLSISVCMPPNEEQNAITTFIENETAKIDALVAEAHTAISLFQERRTALISAAVTGQIDVRNLASTLPA